jgi:hypothetical protein
MVTTSPGINIKDYVLKLVKNLYGQRQAGRVWYLHLVKHLVRMGFLQSQVDPCVFSYNQCVVLIYVDDTILLGPSKQEIDKIILMPKSTFDTQDQDSKKPNDYFKCVVLKRIYPLGTSSHNPDGTIDRQGIPFANPFHYRSIIGRITWRNLLAQRSPIRYINVHGSWKLLPNYMEKPSST